MAILNYAVSASELVDGEGEWGSSSAAYRSPYVKESVEVQNSSLPTFELDFTSSPKVWVSFYSRNIFTQNSGELLTLYGDGGTKLLSVDNLESATTPNAGLTLYDTGGTGTVIHQQKPLIGGYNIARTDILWDSLSGVVEIYLDKVLLHSHATDLSLHENPNKIIFSSTVGGSAEHTYSAIFVSDQDSRPITMHQHEIVAGATHNDFIGNVTDLNSFGTMNGEGMSYYSAGTRQTFTIGSLPTSGTVLALGISSRGGSPVGDSVGFKHTMGDGITDAEGQTFLYNTGDDMKSRKTIFTTKQDGSAITTADLPTLELGIKGV